MINTREIAEEYRLSHWAQIMHERMESGMSIKAYCRQLGISTNTYFYRQKKLRESACAHLAAQDHESLKASAPHGWARLMPAEPFQAKGSLTIEVGGCIVTATTETAPELLLQVCRTLKSLC